MTGAPAAEVPAALLADALEGGSPGWFRALLEWLFAAPPGPERTARLASLQAALDAHPARGALLALVRERWDHPSAVRFLAETGVPTQASLPRELGFRLGTAVLPRLPDDADLGAIVADLRPTDADAAWVEGLDDAALGPWRDALAPPRERLLEAAHLVATRIAAVGLSRNLLDLAGNPPVAASPFLELPARIAAAVTAARTGEPLPDWAGPLERCRAAYDDLGTRLDRRGVSTDLVFQLELLDALLARAGTLLLLATRPPRGEGQRCAGRLLRAVAEARSLRAVLRTATKRLARKMVEFTGETGEHYTVRTRAEWREHFGAALAAGFLTTFTALAKFGIGALPLAPFLAGLGYWANYSASFCVMQVNHWLLASKQPAMTAAALAAALDDGHTAREQEIELIAGITRSQVIVTLGNALATMALAFLLDLLVGLATGHRVLSTEQAAAGLRGIHPLRSLTAVYATTTGISLWLASLAAGWAANWSAFRRLPEAIPEDRRVRALLGAAGARRLGAFVARHFGGIAGYVALGLLLGFVPVLFAKFLGIGLEVRHITLQAASVTFTFLPLADRGLLHWQDVAWALAGIALTGLLNFTVSFALALRTALRARGLSAEARRELWRDLRRAIRAEPLRFLWRPPR